MSSVVAVVGWERGDDDGRTELIGRMLVAAPWRRPDGVWTARLGSGILGFGLRATTKRQRQALSPIFIDPVDFLAAACDARIDNLADIHRELGLEVETKTDAELVARCYQRWGLRAAEHIDGDFAFVVWDYRSRRVYAARDRFGVRSLHYCVVPNGILLATEAGQLLEDPKISKVIDSRAVLDHLTWQYERHRRTFFEAITRIEPGHFVVADASSVVQRRYFNPRATFESPVTGDDHSLQLLSVLRGAVAERLSDVGTTGVHVSGGLDSSSVACIASALTRGGGQDTVGGTLLGLAALFPGLECDEAPYIDAVRACARIDVSCWNGAPDYEEPSEFTVVDRATPFGRLVGIGNGPPHDFELLAKARGRVLLTGEGGNQITTDLRFGHTLVREHRWRDALGLLRRLERESGREAIGPHSVATLLWWAGTAFLPSAVATSLGPLCRRVIRRQREAPRWLGPRLRPLWSEADLERPNADEEWANPRQRDLWDQITSARQEWVADYLDLSAARFGIEVRSPFRDTALATFMLSLPDAAWSGWAGPRGLLRRAVSGLVPMSVVERLGGVSFAAAQIKNVARSFSLLRSTLTGTRWECGDYVNQRAARTMLDGLDPRRPATADWSRWICVREFAALEIWMRGL